MRLLFSILKIALLVLLSVCFLCVLFGTITIGVVDHKLVDEDFYKSHLKDGNFYERVYTDVLPEIKDIPSYYGGLSISAEDRDQVIRDIITPEWLQQQVEAVIDTAVPYLRSDTDNLALVIDLQQVKTDAPSKIVQFVRQKLDSLPECSPGQTPDLSHITSGVLPDCLPEQPGSAARQAFYEPFMPRLASYISNVVARAPDNVDLIDEAAVQWENGDRDAVMDRLHDARNVIDWFVNKIGLVKAYLAMLVLMTLIALLNIGKLRAALRWAGGTMLFTALPMLVMGIVIKTAGPDMFRDRMDDVHDIPASIVKLASDLGVSAIKDVSWSVIVPAAVFTAVGLVLFVLSFVMGRQKQSKSGDQGKN